MVVLRPSGSSQEECALTVAPSLWPPCKFPYGKNNHSGCRGSAVTTALMVKMGYTANPTPKKEKRERGKRRKKIKGGGGEQ